MPAAKGVEFILCTDRIQAAYDDVAPLERVTCGLPDIPDHVHIGIRLHALNHPTRNVDLARAVLDVLSRASDQAVQIGILDDVGIGEHKGPNTNVRELLRDVRSATAEARDTDPRLLQNPIAVRAQEALPIKPVHQRSPNFTIGAPTAVKSDA